MATGAPVLKSSKTNETDTTRIPLVVANRKHRIMEHTTFGTKRLRSDSDPGASGGPAPKLLKMDDIVGHSHTTMTASVKSMDTQVRIFQVFKVDGVAEKIIEGYAWMDMGCEVKRDSVAKGSWLESCLRPLQRASRCHEIFSWRRHLIPIGTKKCPPSHKWKTTSPRSL